MEDPDGPGELVERHVRALVESRIADFRVTIVNGPRQAGKTTLLRRLHTRLGGAFVTLDDADQRAARARRSGRVSPGHAAPAVRRRGSARRQRVRAGHQGSSRP